MGEVARAQRSDGEGDRPGRDAARDAFLASEGIRTLRYQASEVMVDPDGVANAIVDAARALITR